jgi:translation initiation factor IF-1
MTASDPAVPRKNGASVTATAARARITSTHKPGNPRTQSPPSPSCIAAPGAKAHRVGPTIQKDHDMAKEELLQFEGLVTEILPDARYRVQLDAGHMVVAYTAGRMKKNRIKTLAGDRVTVEISPYDLEKGRLIFRHKDERAGSASRPAPRKHFHRR